jgi:integrase
MENERKKRRRRGQIIPRGPQPGYKPGREDFGIRVPLNERGQDGRGKSHYETLRNVTSFQAEKRLGQLLARIDGGEFFTAKKITVKDFGKEWLAQRERDGLKKQSIYNYEDTCNHYINPHIGKLWLGDVKGSTVRDLYNSLQDKGLAHNTIKQAARVARQMFKAAVTWGHIKSSPAEGVKPPTGGPGRVAHAFDTEQALNFIRVCTENPQDLIFVLYLATGVRPRELTGLTSPHLKLVSQTVEQDGKPVTVERGVVEVRQIAFRERWTGRWTLTPPKTKKSVRDVPFPAALYHQLMLHREQVMRQKAMMGRGWNELDLVFPSPKGTPIDANYLREGRFKALLKRAGLPLHFTLYSFRYTFATLQLLAGERDKVIADLMGHEKADFTAQVYQKVLPEMRERASDRLAGMLFDGPDTIFTQTVNGHEM